MNAQQIQRIAESLGATGSPEYAQGCTYWDHPEGYLVRIGLSGLWRIGDGITEREAWVES